MRRNKKGWAYRIGGAFLAIAIAADTIANCLIPPLPFRGDRYLCGETISRRAARARDAGSPLGAGMCWALDRLDPGHCDDALLSVTGD